jgi:rhomboid protease GluP
MNYKELLLTPYFIIIIFCVAVYFVPILLGFNFQFVNFFVKDNLAIKAGEYYRILSSVFLHGSVTHLLLNMYSLWNTGPMVMNISNILGRNSVADFLTVFFVSGVLGSIFSYLFTLNPSLGASGAIFGLIGFVMAFAIIKNQVELAQNIAIIIIINVLYSMVERNIDNWAHFGGFVGGILTGFLFLLM